MESSNGHAAATQTNISEPEVQTPNGLGCGCSNATSTKSATILISVTPTTGGQFEIPVLKTDTIENVKKLISKKLKVPRDRICLLHRERQLRDGSTVQDNQLVEGSRLTLLPSVETGLLAQRPEQSVMQALESLNDSQVNDFLSGKAPLNLTMRLGDHMMLIQLQLSTISPSTSRRSATASSSSSSSSPRKSPCKVHPPPLDIPIETAALATAATLCSPTAEASSLKTSSASMLDTSSLTSTSSSVPLCKNVPCKCMSSSAASAAASSASSKPLLDTRALAEASRNLTQTLKQLSSEVLTSKSEPKEESSSSSACSSPTVSIPSSPTHTSTASEHSTLSSPSSSSSNSTSFVPTTPSSSSGSAGSSSSSKRRQGAIIESMHHHGKGVYSGTFSGTLNPALQDKFGRPKRDISTIIHILNDLLCATPQYRAARTTALDIGPSTVTGVKSTSDMSTNTDTKMGMVSGGGAGGDSVENQATRDKMERLRVIMEERRERRRMKRATPYSQWSAKSESRDVISQEVAMDTGESLSPPEPLVA